MTDEIVQFHSLRLAFGWVFSGLVLTLFGGYFVSIVLYPYLEVNLLTTLISFFLLTFGFSFIDFYLGWKFKRGNLDYSPPEWEFSAVQLKIDDAKKLPREYNRKFKRLVAVPHYMYYFLPIVIIIASIALPMYNVYIASTFYEQTPIIFSLLLTSIHIVSFWGGWRSTSSKTSGDFTLPLIREAVKLATIQSRVTGIAHTRVIFDKAEEAGYEIYRNPRVVSRISSLEEEAYIESSTEELGSVEKVLVRSYKKDDTLEIIWWWSSTDRNYRKYVGENQEGYYVKNPIPSRVSELGVKDVSLIFENAVALLVLERIRLLGSTDDLTSIVTSLGIESP
ncbi:MAG: hypothetical protein ACW98Y_08335 [Candidatus Thorarchaeota archaeon]